MTTFSPQHSLPPCEALEESINIFNNILYDKYWLCFGGLYGQISNQGIVPDGDLDICVMYGEDYRAIVESFARQRYTMQRVLLNDTDQNRALYAGFNRPGMPHVCVSFWYLHEGKRWWCHDSLNELRGVGVPSVYNLKGCPEDYLQSFRYAEWPGIPCRTKVRVPDKGPSILDLCYPGWAYKMQRYQVEHYRPQWDKIVSVNDPLYARGRFFENAASPYQAKLKSMREWK